MDHHILHFDLIPTTAYAIYPSQVYVTGMKLGWECLYRKATNLLQVTIDAFWEHYFTFFFKFMLLSALVL